MPAQSPDSRVRPDGRRGLPDRFPWAERALLAHLDGGAVAAGDQREDEGNRARHVARLVGFHREALHFERPVAENRPVDAGKRDMDLRAASVAKPDVAAVLRKNWILHKMKDF